MKPASTAVVLLVLGTITHASGSSLLAQTSPVWLANVPTPTANAVATQYPKDEDIKVAPLGGPYPLDISTYPRPLKMPPSDHPEVQEVMKHIDWSKVPKIQPRTIKDYLVDTSGYDPRTDTDCWWTASTCKKPKLDYLPEDIYTCPKAGQWGLNYDDGPLRVWSFDQEKRQWEEPRFYNFMVEHNKQKATLFFIGSNVITFPEAAQRALNDGHTICAHTWSHQQMTSLTDGEVVAELYWTHKAIKEVLGITPKCWRPPYGDVDDRVRAIAWQMGMRTIIWDQDSNDWNLVSLRMNLFQHENSNSTVSMSERWLPEIQKVFDVMPIHQCLNDPYPYWEESWTYPTADNPSLPSEIDHPNSVRHSESSGHSAGGSKQGKPTSSAATRSTNTFGSSANGSNTFRQAVAVYLIFMIMSLIVFT
ncbi:hypothetical protein BX666DRAFT_1854970 [Dichotomocladium elegans]|nr:hypothetical protein BX666DRAFT_1854970 [Dichotomocladium elegans]